MPSCLHLKVVGTLRVPSCLHVWTKRHTECAYYCEKRHTECAYYFEKRYTECAYYFAFGISIVDKCCASACSGAGIASRNRASSGPGAASVRSA